MNADGRLQRRVQRYGWDLAADRYESLWAGQLAPAQAGLLQMASLAAGEDVLDVACGTGLVTLAAAQAVGPTGRVTGVDLSEGMVDAALRRASERGGAHASFARMDAEALELPDGSFDAALCALGLMYLPQPERALQEMHRVLRPGGRMVAAVWGARARCGWSGLFEIVDAEVASDVCPLFFRLGEADTLARACTEAGFTATQATRISVPLPYANAGQACDAAFAGGPVALAWSRFSEPVRARVASRYLESIAAWRHGDGYAVPAEFVLVTGGK